MARSLYHRFLRSIRLALALVARAVPAPHRTCLTTVQPVLAAHRPTHLDMERNQHAIRYA